MRGEEHWVSHKESVMLALPDRIIFDIATIHNKHHNFNKIFDLFGLCKNNTFETKVMVIDVTGLYRLI
jgi:hypothetical protein